MKKVLFIDRDGTLVIEPPVDYQLDSLEKLTFYPKVFQNLARIYKELDYELIMVTNQDGLGTASFPEATFWPAQNKIIEAFKNEGVVFQDVLIDASFPADNSPNRKPRIGMVEKFMNGEYDLENSFVIGDRLTDMEFANNIGCKGIFIAEKNSTDTTQPALTTISWEEIYQFLSKNVRKASVKRTTKETDISISINLDGMGKAKINTGISFFDHMLDQIAKHGMIDLYVDVIGDLDVDEHHTIEDTAIALGEVFLAAIGDKIGMERYGYCLPMDDCLAQVAIDFGGRNWLEWDAVFKREMVGKMPTEMFVHFFKSFSDGARCNLNIKAEGVNEHHKIEAIFKAFAKSIKMAVKRDMNRMVLPSTKGVL